MISDLIKGFDQGKAAEYLTQTHQSFSLLLEVLRKGSVVSQASLSFLEAYTDILGLYKSKKEQKYIRIDDKLLISKQSGLPTYSRIFDLVNEQEKVTDNKRSREIGLIVEDIVSSFYENDRLAVQSFYEEYQKAYLESRMDSITSFATQYEELEDSFTSKGKKGLKKYTVNYSDFAIDEQSIVNLTIDLYAPTKLFGTQSIPTKTIKGSLTNGVKVIHEKLKKENVFPTVIKKTQPYFYMPGVIIQDQFLEEMVQTYGPILDFSIETFENEEQMLVENKKELRAIMKYEDEDFEYSCRSILVAPEAATQEIRDYAIENDLPYEVISR